MIQQFHSWVFIQKNCSQDLKEIFVLLCHCSVIHNSHIEETTQMFIDGWIDKENVVNTYNGMLFRHKKEGNPAIWDSMDDLEDVMLSEICQS